MMPYGHSGVICMTSIIALEVVPTSSQLPIRIDYGAVLMSVYVLNSIEGRINLSNTTRIDLCTF